MVKNVLNCFVGINFLPTHILDSLQNTKKTDYYLSNLNNMTRTGKNFKTVFVKFVGKIGHSVPYRLSLKINLSNADIFAIRKVI